MRAILALSIFAISTFSAPAFAACEKSVSATVTSLYPYWDIGYLVYDGPAQQTDFQLQCGPHWNLSLWASKALAPKDKGETENYGNEVEFTATYSTSLESPLGPLEVTASAAYWAISPLPSLSDDIVDIHLKVGRPFEIGRLTVTPYVEPFARLGVSSAPNAAPREFFVSVGADFNFPINEKWEVDAHVWHVASYSATYGNTPIRVDAEVTRKIGGGFEVVASGKWATTMPAIFSIGIAKSF